MGRLHNKRILLGVTGSIAAFKACEVLRILQREGAEVQVVMTQAAQKFIAPLTFETLSKYEVVTEMFPQNRVVKTRHVSLADWADLILVCPATANVMGKVASGIADDFLSTVIMASRAPVVFAPAMDYQMVQNPIYLSNCEKLKSFNYTILPTEEGELASGLIGQGRLIDFKVILHTLFKVLLGSTSLKSKKILISAGPTHEPIDPVRYISNRSSGKMGLALAEEAFYRSADVTLIHGPVQEKAANGIATHDIETAEEMASAVLKLWKKNDVLIMAAAVADYTPLKRESQKMKKNAENFSVQLTLTQDILAEAANQKGKRIVVGFALETEEEEKYALEKLKNKHLDLICVNNPMVEGAAFGSNNNKITMIDRNLKKTELPLMPKWEAAGRILDNVESLL